MKSSSRKRTKMTITAFAASLLIGALSSAAMAQNNPVANFDQDYLNEHPQVAQQLSANPNLAADPQFMQSHPGLQRYLADHPGMRKYLADHPQARRNLWRDRRRFAEREYESRAEELNERQGNPNGYPGAGSLPPQAAQPNPMNNPQFRADHPQAQNYLKNHPEARNRWRERRYDYMRRANRFRWRH
jgi:hypothetical protein